MSAVDLDSLSAIDSLLSDEERLVQSTVRRFVKERFLPRASACFEQEVFPRELALELGELGALGAHINGFGCAAMSAAQYGLLLQELEYGDSALRSFASVQGSLAMHAIYAGGDETQQRKYLPEMAQGKLIGCFGLTEPDSGSDPSSMLTTARKDGSHYVLSGTKMWITNSPICDLAVVWAKVDSADASSIRGFIVERGTSGFETPRIKGKLSLRASETGEIVLSDCRVHERQMLVGKPGLGAPLSCLSQARFGIAWGALGAAKACLEAALSYAKTRVAFGVPIAKKQLVQHELVEMASEIIKAELLVLHFARLKDRDGKISPVQVSLCKRNNVAQALNIARRCRALLGANGILLDYPVLRHALNLESVYTYEGTHEVHTLILGKALTGEDAF